MNSDSEAELRARISELEARLSRLESQRFANTDRPTPVIPLPIEAIANKLVTAETPKSALAEAARIYRGGEQQKTELPPETFIPVPPVEATSVISPVISPLIQPPPRVAAHTVNYQAPRRAEVPQGNFERTIGLKLAGWLGAIVLLIGIGFGVKFIYDQHWFGAIPPIVWLAAVFAGGFALIGLGELVYRRINQMSAVGLYGAGVATLFLAGYVGSSYYKLYSPGAALLLMAAAALVGGAVALRGNLVSIAVLALIGGNLAPLVIANPNSPLRPFLFYLLAMQLVALALASVGTGRKWWTLRGLSLATTAFWVWGSLDRPGMSTTVMLFAAVYATLYQLEPILTAMRRRIGEAIADPVVFAVVTTSAFCTLLLDYTQHDPAASRGRWVLLLGLIVGTFGWTLTLLASRQERFAVWWPLAMAHRWSSIGLLALAVPIGLHGAPVEATWAVMAMVLAIVGSRGESTIARCSAAIVWALAVGHVAIDAQDHLLTVCTIAGVEITRQLLLGLALALVGQFVARALSSETKDSHGSATLVSVGASVVWCVASFCGLPPMWGTTAIVMYAWLLMSISRWCPTLPLIEQFVLLVAAALAKWSVEIVQARLSDEWSASARWVVLNAQFGIGTVLAGSIAWIAAVAGRIERIKHIDRRTIRAVLWTVAAIVFLCAGSFEIDRYFSLIDGNGQLGWSLDHARQCAFTVWWTCAASAALIALRRFDREPNVRNHWPTLLPVLIRLIALKYLTVDLLYFGAMQGGLGGVVPVFNLSIAVASAVVIALTLDATGWPGHPEFPQQRSVTFPYLLIATIVWIAGSMEVMRIARASIFAEGSASLSVYWSITAIAAVTSGFVLRNAGLRFFGLGLFGLTCLKVVIIDMSGLATGYRVLSFMGLGVLMIGTSVLYGRFGAGLLESAKPQAAE